MLQSTEDPHCIECKRGWSSEFMAANFPLSFRNDTLRKHRRGILFEREKSLLPAMQIFVEYRKNIAKFEQEVKDLRAVYGYPDNREPTAEEETKVGWRFKKMSQRVGRIKFERESLKKRIMVIDQQSIQDLAAASNTGAVQEILTNKMRDILPLQTLRKELKKELAELEEPYRELTAEHRRLSDLLNAAIRSEWQNRQLYLNGDGAPAQRREFIMKCADETCRGFLSTAYKCGTCEKWTCAHCLVVVGTEKDAAHTCDPNTVETAKAIKTETRPCPKCGTRIFKIDGCFAKDTPILTWDGQIKSSQDICVGDELIGDDGTKRIVEELCSGEDEMYEVCQMRGSSYTVNSKHKLTLKPYNHISSRSEPALWIVKWFNGQSFSTKQFSERGVAEAFLQGLNLPDVIEITVDDYMKLSQASKDLLYGYKGHEIHWPHKDVRLDPYLMGLWLGDGVNNGMDFACNPAADPEIIQYLLGWCDKNDCELIHDDAYRFRVRRAGVTRGRDAMNHGATSATCKGCAKKKCDLCDLPNLILETTSEALKKNPLKEAFEHYGLIQNKHIPCDYLVNDRETRLQLLAGLVDTDGHLGNDGKRIQIPQANHSMAKQIALLARSLGFVVSVDLVKKENVPFPNTERKDYASQLRVSVSGTNLSDIPTRILRKKCYNSAPNKDWFKTSISVKAVGKGTYFGWSITGNKRFIMEDMTCLRNCDQMWCIMDGCQTAFSWDTGHIVTGKVHNPHYYEWLRRNGGGAPREVGDIPCGGLPAIHELFRVMRPEEIPGTVKGAIFETHRNLRELIDMRLYDFPARPPNLVNKDIDVHYLMNDMSEDEWKRQLELSEAKFQRKKEIGQILQTLATAGADLMNHVVNRAGPDPAIYAVWLSETAMPEFEQLRAFGNDSLKGLAKRDRIAVPQFEANWAWKPLRALYKPVKVAEATA